jgi:hypothetical protein
MSFWVSSRPLLGSLNKARRPISIITGLVCITVMGHAQEVAERSGSENTSAPALPITHSSSSSDLRAAPNYFWIVKQTLTPPRLPSLVQTLADGHVAG